MPSRNVRLLAAWDGLVSEGGKPLTNWHGECTGDKEKAESDESKHVRDFFYTFS